MAGEIADGLPLVFPFHQTLWLRQSPGQAVAEIDLYIDHTLYPMFKADLLIMQNNMKLKAGD